MESFRLAILFWEIIRNPLQFNLKVAINHFFKLTTKNAIVIADTQSGVIIMVEKGILELLSHPRKMWIICGIDMKQFFCV